MSCKLSNFQTPVVIRSRYVKKWPCHAWTINEWASACQGVKFPFRLHAFQSQSVQWENQAADHFEATLDQFISWSKGSATGDNPFSSYARNEFWAYSSYNYMKKLFESKKELLEMSRWSDLDLGVDVENDGTSSTIWIGTKDAYTPCHLDTYGFNLVSQVAGKKMWILFPKEDEPYLYPTRIPYEESSVFSSVNVLDPDFSEHPKFKNAHPHIVILEPGDVLYVPHHWWHFVQCVDDGNSGLCVSINTWRQFEDCKSLFSESIVRFLTSVLFTQIENGQDWINDRADLFSPAEALGYIRLLSEQILENDDHSNVLEANSKSDTLKPPESWEFLKSTTVCAIGEQLGWKPSEESCIKPKQLQDSDIVKCILDPEVVELISSKILSAMKH